MKIGFNKPYLTGKELTYIEKAVKGGKISGDGVYSKLCHHFFETRYGFKKALLTTSCTDALEMAAILLDIKEGDEVIIPSYTFVSTANAFILRGARIVFADSQEGHPNIDADALLPLITPKTKAIVVVHYAGVACDMDKIMSIANAHNLYVVEDAAQAIDSYYKDKPLGGIGHIGCFSFHESKNVNCGEGGLLVINDDGFVERAEIIWEKGTNRASFFRGEIKKYEWVDIGSSFLLSDLNAAFLYAQLEQLELVQKRRLDVWNRYHFNLAQIEIELPQIPNYSTNNAHNFYVVCNSVEQRFKLSAYLNQRGIEAPIHYLPLHCSPYFKDKHDGRVLPNAQRFSDCLLRLPLYYELAYLQQMHITDKVHEFFQLNDNKVIPKTQLEKVAIAYSALIGYNVFNLLATELPLL